MKKRTFVVALILLAACFTTAYAKDQSLEGYLSEFDYQARKDMKIDSKSLVKGLMEVKIQLIDIRFQEEFEAWRMGSAINIPLNELPGRLDQLQKDKIIVTACPHKDRAILAMAYLRTKGFRSKYLVDGLVGLAEHLRGDKARDFVNSVQSK
ncbi:MAG: rhodanese-like domain-containing protein [Deltaproteobacteria bacterium]|nr:MAG: rhodanese-like domain-containing protein [Deltaproteobacteria bacterium]